MRKLTLISILSISSSFLFSQQNLLLFKKETKTIQRFWKGSFIAFQLENKEWQKGEIIKIQKDSFYIQPMVIQYNLFGADTLRYDVIGYSLSDVYALPKKGVLIDYKDGQFQIIRSAGHVHWYWIKSGWVFRVGAVGYSGLHVANGIIKNDFSFSKSKKQLSTAGGVFLGGFLLKLLYKPTLRLRTKYRMETFQLRQD